METVVFLTFAISLITAIITGFSVIISKENLVSGFRQAWINDQRADLAEAISEARAYVHETDGKEKLKRLLAFDKALNKVELRENPNKAEWKAVLDALNKVRTSLLDNSASDAMLEAERVLILNAAKRQLKDNWTIVKKGETYYSYFKWLPLILLFSLAVALLLFNGSHLDHGFSPINATAKPNVSVQPPARIISGPPKSLTPQIDRTSDKPKANPK